MPRAYQTITGFPIGQTLLRCGCAAGELMKERNDSHEKMKALSAILSLTLGMTSLPGMTTVFAADEADTPAAVAQTAEQKYSYDDILDIGFGVRKLRRVFDENGLDEAMGYKLWIEATVKELLNQNKFPAILLNAEKHSLTEAEAAAVREATPMPTIAPEGGMLWTLDKPGYEIEMPWDRFHVKLKKVQTEDGKIYCEVVYAPFCSNDYGTYVSMLRSALNIAQIYGQSLEICTEKMNEDFYGSDTVPENQYQLPEAAASVQLLPVSRVTAGDVNGDGSADVADAVLIARFVAEDAEVTITEKGLAAADIDGSGKVTQDDITMLLKRIAKKI